MSFRILALMALLLVPAAAQFKFGYYSDTSCGTALKEGTANSERDKEGGGDPTHLSLRGSCTYLLRTTLSTHTFPTADECVNIASSASLKVSETTDGKAAIGSYGTADCTGQVGIVGPFDFGSCFNPQGAQVSFKVTKGLSGGAIAGIVIGSLVAVGIVVVFMWKYKKGPCFAPKK
jgi:hypothetical protein